MILAYVDPGTGSILIQGIVVGVMSIALIWSNFKGKIKSLRIWKKQESVQFGKPIHKED